MAVLQTSSSALGAVSYTRDQIRSYFFFEGFQSLNRGPISQAAPLDQVQKPCAGLARTLQHEKRDRPRVCRTQRRADLCDKTLPHFC